jgi:cell division protein FtsL
MKAMIRRERRQTLYTWILWLPVIVPVFCMLFADVWLSVETRRHDYELFHLNTARRKLEAELDTIRVDEAQLEALNRLAVKAPELGLVKPEPDQIVVVRGTLPALAGPAASPMLLAQGGVTGTGAFFEAPLKEASAEEYPAPDPVPGMKPESVMPREGAQSEGVIEAELVAVPSPAAARPEAPPAAAAERPDPVILGIPEIPLDPETETGVGLAEMLTPI